jgi:hypothetical protein
LETISADYRALNRKLHEDVPNYGTHVHRHATSIIHCANKIGAVEILDYGCGKGALAPILRQHGFLVHEYDPAIVCKDSIPEPAEFVYCGDVAEHVEPEYLEAFLDDLRRVCRTQLFIVVNTHPSMKVLADGRNAHLIQQPIEWWLPKLRERFLLEMIAGHEKEFSFLGRPK